MGADWLALARVAQLQKQPRVNQEFETLSTTNRYNLARDSNSTASSPRATLARPEMLPPSSMADEAVALATALMVPVVLVAVEQALSEKVAQLADT